VGVALRRGGRTQLIRLGGICGLAGPIIALAGVSAAIATSPWFRWDSNFLSDLGVSAAAHIFNGSLIIGGLLMIIFVIGLNEHLPKKLPTRVGIGLALAGALGLTLIGVFPEDQRPTHFIASLGFFVLFPSGLIAIGIGLRRGRMAPITIVTGMVALLLISSLHPLLRVVGVKVGFAVPEMAEASVLSAWTLAMAAELRRSIEKLKTIQSFGAP